MCVYAQPLSFTTLREINGAAVTFNYPSGLALDRAGNLYVSEGIYSEVSLHRIRKVTPAGVVTTLAGSGVPGFADGTGTTAQFYNPTGLALDNAGNVYVADGDNYRIRKITPDGAVTTLAGSGVRGFADGIGASAQFDFINGMAVDSAGNLYVGDTYNSRIRKITPAGVVSTFAGSGFRGSADGLGEAAEFSFPCGVAVDRTGTVFVTENESESGHRIRKITAAGMVSTLAGSGLPGFADGKGTAAQFNFPWGVVVDNSGNLYVADTLNRRIRKVTSAGEVSTVGGSGRSGSADGNGPDAQFWSPSAVTIDSTGEQVYVADWGGQSIRKAQVAPVLQPLERLVFPGGAFRLEISVPGTANAYQWFRDGVALSGQTQNSILINNATDADSGRYTATVTNSFAVSSTSAASVRVSSEGSRLINMSSRINLASGQMIIPSFFVQGTGSKEIVIRAVGPGLSVHGVSGVLDDPQLTLYSGSTAMARNDNWDAAALESATRRVGAFGLSPGSKDAALVASLAAGQAYTVQVSGVGAGSGVVLIEVYDADGPRPASRLANVSVRGGTGTGASALIVGFVVQGLGQRPLLIRGAGPALAAFDVPGRLEDPELSVYNEYNLKVAANARWEDADSVSAVRLATTSAGAFQFAAGSHDTAALVLLHTGSYTVQVTSASNRSGEVLAEVYDAP